MAEVMSQDEIDALLTGINADDLKDSKDFDEALDHFEKHLTANVTSGQFHIKMRHFFGFIYNHGVERNMEKANYWLTKAAEQGDADAQYYFGLIHQKGQGVPKDYSKAAEWFAKAAEQGHAKAKDSLAKAEAAALDEENRRQIRKKLGNRIFPNFKGHEYHGLTAIPTDNPKICIYLMRRVDDKTDSLWNIEFLDDEGNWALWRYEGEDYDKLMLELMELHIETGLENF